MHIAEYFQGLVANGEPISVFHGGTGVAATVAAPAPGTTPPAPPDTLAGGIGAAVLGRPTGRTSGWTPATLPSSELPRAAAGALAGPPAPTAGRRHRRRPGAAPAASSAAAVVFTLVVTYGLGQALVRADDPGATRRRCPPPRPPPRRSTGQVPLEQAIPTLIPSSRTSATRGSSPVPQVVGPVEADFEVGRRDGGRPRQARSPATRSPTRPSGSTGPDDDLRAELRARSRRRWSRGDLRRHRGGGPRARRHDDPLHPGADRRRAHPCARSASCRRLPDPPVAPVRRDVRGGGGGRRERGGRVGRLRVAAQPGRPGVLRAGPAPDRGHARGERCRPGRAVHRHAADARRAPDRVRPAARIGWLGRGRPGLRRSARPRASRPSTRRRSPPPRRRWPSLDHSRAPKGRGARLGPVRLRRRRSSRCSPASTCPTGRARPSGAAAGSRRGGPRAASCACGPRVVGDTDAQTTSLLLPLPELGRPGRLRARRSPRARRDARSIGGRVAPLLVAAAGQACGGDPVSRCRPRRAARCRARRTGAARRPRRTGPRARARPRATRAPGPAGGRCRATARAPGPRSGSITSRPA